MFLTKTNEKIIFSLNVQININISVILQKRRCTERVALNKKWVKLWKLLQEIWTGIFLRLVSKNHILWIYLVALSFINSFSKSLFICNIFKIKEMSIVGKTFKEFCFNFSKNMQMPKVGMTLWLSFLKVKI